jgi:hypothetical protein
METTTTPKATLVCDSDHELLISLKMTLAQAQILIYHLDKVRDNDGPAQWICETILEALEA